MQPTFIPRRLAAEVEYFAGREQAQRDEAQERAESRAELVADMAAARLTKKLAALTHDDLVAGLHSVTQEKHGAALRAAWLESAEALGDLVMTLVRDQLADEANLEAEEALAAIEAEARAGAAPRRRTFVIAGV